MVTSTDPLLLILVERLKQMSGRQSEKPPLEHGGTLMDGIRVGGQIEAAAQGNLCGQIWSPEIEILIL